MKRLTPSLNAAVWISIIVALLFAAVFVFRIFRGPSIEIINSQSLQPLSPFTGKPCAKAQERPIAVMLASDPEARPLSAIGQADMIFEMPVTPNGITRMMAVYQCTDPKEIGSIRSAREDFIPLAQGVDAILAHWGGERDALDALNAHVVDNVDALKYEGTTFYRKPKVPRPHNGFTTLTLVRERAEQLGYRATTSVTPYAHVSGNGNRTLGTLSDTVSVPWLQGMDVRFSYDESTRSYLRWRGDSPEIDAATETQARAGVVIVMQTSATFNRDQYINVRTVGTGAATIYQGGRSVTAVWKKPTATAMLTFTDSQGSEIPLEPGTIWVLIDAPLPATIQ